MNEFLTGRWRHRVKTSWFSSDHKLILQVEYQSTHRSYHDPMDPKIGEKYTSWRDATAFDLQDLGLVGGLEDG
jgi:hypothetical protein